MSIPADLIETIERAQWPLVVGHVNPDTDALGSMFALARAMPCRDAAIALPMASVPSKTQFLLSLGAGVPVAGDDRVAASDVVIVVDTAGTNRINVNGKWDAIAGKTVLNIDHHITNTDFGRINHVVDNAASTSELIYGVIVSAGWPLDETTATLLYAGIWSDTSGFSLPTVTAETFETAAALVRAGADIERVGQRLDRSHEPHEFDLVRAVYHNTKIAGNGHIAYSTLTHEEITGVGCTGEDIDDQVSIPRSLSGIRMAILFSEGTPGVIRINLRGEDGTSVLPLAERLGGGGHEHSAGVRMRGVMAEVVQRVLAEATKELN